MIDSWKGWLFLIAIGMTLSASAATPAPPPPGPPEPPKEVGPVLKAMLGDERVAIEKEIAARMMKRGDLGGDKRARLEMEIDLRIIERALVTQARDAKSETNEQAVAWLRSKQFRDAVRGMEDALSQDGAALQASQKEGLGQLHKLSFSVKDLKSGDLDAFCKSAAIVMVNCVNTTPVNIDSILPMRPKPQANTAVTASDRPATVGELTEEVQKLAAISVPLRQQLLALAAAASAAAGAEDKENATALYGVLSQSIGLAHGLQSNTAVGNEARAGIEGQLAEGIVLFSDQRTRDAGKARIDSLGQYRQTLTRIGKMGLSKDQMDQLSPAFAWAQANPDLGAKLLGTVEDYVTTCSKWDSMPKDATVPASLKRAFDDVRQQFGRNRTAFIQAASRMAGAGSTPAEMEQALDELRRVQTVTDDLTTMQSSFDTINSYKIKPVGGLERKVTTAALAAAGPTASANRNDGQKFLSSVHALAKLSQTLEHKPLTDIPPAILQTWGGSSANQLESHSKKIVEELAYTLLSGTIELDKTKIEHLQTALQLGDTLRTAAQLEAALAKAPALSRWADWAIDPASLQLVMTPYKESVAAAIFGFASDNQEPLDRWNRLSNRYGPLITLILHDVSYAEQCQQLPIGFAADIGRLITPFSDAPFATERYMSYAIGVWAIMERTGEIELGDHMSVGLAKRIAHDLKLPVTVDEGPGRVGKRPRL